MRLHGSVGPARTTFSMVAEQAGVQRHTLYAHFPDEKSLLLACSGHHLEIDPPPDAAPWTGIADRHERRRVALGEIYAWYERNADLIACVLRDAEHHEVLREVAQMRLGPHFAAWAAVLGAAESTPAEAAVLRLALSFHTWRTLAREAGLGSAAAAEAMVAAIGSGAAASMPESHAAGQDTIGRCQTTSRAREG